MVMITLEPLPWEEIRLRLAWCSDNLHGGWNHIFVGRGSFEARRNPGLTAVTKWTFVLFDMVWC